MMTLMVKMMLVWWNKYVIGDDGNPVFNGHSNDDLDDHYRYLVSMVFSMVSYQQKPMKGGSSPVIA